MRKMYFLVLALFYFNSLSLFSQWEQCKQGLYGGSFYSLALDSSGIIYTGGNNGKIYYSTNDGQSWVYLNSMPVKETINSLAILNNNLIAGTNYYGIFISGDKGQNWKNISQGLKNDDILTIKIKNNSIYIGTMSGGIYKSSDLGNSWVEINNGLASLKVNAIEFIQNKIIIGTDKGYYESTNDGNDWFRLMEGIPSEKITDIAVVENFIFVGTWGDGIYRKSLNEESWTIIKKWGSHIYYEPKLYNFLSAIIINGTDISIDYGEKWYDYSFGLDDHFTTRAIISKDTTIFMACQNGIFSRTMSGERWNLTNNGLYNLSIFDFEKIGNNIFTATYGNGIFFTQDNGDNWEQILRTENHYAPKLAKYKNDLVAYLFGQNFEGLYINDSKNNDTNYNSWNRLNYGNGLYSSYIQDLKVKDSIFTLVEINLIYISSNGGKKWIRSVIDTSIKYITASLISGNDIYISTNSGLFKSSDYGVSWKQIAVNNPNTLTYLIDDIDGNLFVSNSEGLFKSSDNGNNWSLICQDSSMKSLRQLIKVNKYFVGINYNGEVYISKNEGINWIPIINGLNDNGVYSLIDSDDYLFAGTFYGSVFRIKLSDLDIVSVNENNNNSYLTIYPNPATDYITINLGSIGACSNENNIWASPNASVEIYDVMGMFIQSIPFETQNIVSLQQRIDVSNLTPGVYFVKIVGSNGACSIVEKFVKY